MNCDKVEPVADKALRERGHTVPQDNLPRVTAQQVSNLVGHITAQTPTHYGCQ